MPNRFMDHHEEDLPQGLVFVAVGIGIGIEIAIDEHSDSDADTDPEISRITSIFRGNPGTASIEECTPI